MGISLPRHLLTDLFDVPNQRRVRRRAAVDQALERFDARIRHPHNASYRLIPAWVWEEDRSDALRPRLRDRVEQGHHCLAVEYQAAALDSNQMIATKKIFEVQRALWLARRTSLSFDTVIHADQFKSSWVLVKLSVIIGCGLCKVMQMNRFHVMIST